MRERATADYWKRVSQAHQKDKKRRHCAEPSTSIARLRTYEPITLEMARARTQLAEISQSR